MKDELLYDEEEDCEWEYFAGNNDEEKKVKDISCTNLWTKLRRAFVN